MFVQVQDFIGTKYDIPNIEDVQTRFQSHIAEIEDDVLNKILGPVLYEEFLAGLAVLPAENILPKWIRLRDGFVYLHDGVNYKFIGLRKALVPFVYANWLMDNTDQYTGVGVIIPGVENGEVISPARRICRAWNEFVNFVGYDSYYESRVDHTLYGYALKHSLDYPGIAHHNIKTINEWSI